MNVQITSRKFKAKESLKTEIKEQLKNLEKFNDEILDANVILSYTHLKDSIKTVEITLSVPGKTFTAEDTSDEYGKSLTKVIAKLQKQLKTLKSKRIAKTR
ncbi:MAG: ribosome-associated translation inhibitor RaiA [Ignavibacteriae bacterium]|nr:ribosome-associated translation inhibitor RaiA [Ignavibacteriota bacterium]MCB9209845.1 ribosome-associated translation inhibitor RaiA [Ignavibacteriales bacterium]MCB9219002.1 ribosome-associated translation inhibitor RaiA [Ignavibacteriales bacterium]